MPARPTHNKVPVAPPRLDALCACLVYSVNDPVHFGDLSASFVSLFRAATMEDWTDIMYIQMYGCKQYNHGDLHWTNFCENSEFSN